MAMLDLGHVGIYVHDLEKMVAFYRDTLGQRITKQNWRAGIVFLSADPERADHEIALFRGRADDTDSRVINQISLRVATLDDLRAVYRRLIDAGLRIDAVVNHVSALGCYYFDPEGNRSEVFWGHRASVLGPHRSPDRYRTVGQGRTGRDRCALGASARREHR
jgi:catechol 2,3-dioxygenase-like lactoylglutathione lyase family enzyme